MKHLPQGKIEPDSVKEVERLLSECWDDLDLPSDSAGMKSYKLLDRTENLTWTPPLLTFDIERHGATALGSIYVHVHHWRVDVEQEKATAGEPVQRVVGVRSMPLNIEPLVSDVTQAILTHKNDACLKWKDDSKVRVLVAEIIPKTNSQTTAGRRKRIREALKNELRPHGWREVTPNTYERY